MPWRSNMAKRTGIFECFLLFSYFTCKPTYIHTHSPTHTYVCVCVFIFTYMFVCLVVPLLHLKKCFLCYFFRMHCRFLDFFYIHITNLSFRFWYLHLLFHLKKKKTRKETIPLCISIFICNKKDMYSIQPHHLMTRHPLTYNSTIRRCFRTISSKEEKHPFSSLLKSPWRSENTYRGRCSPPKRLRMPGPLCTSRSQWSRNCGEKEIWKISHYEQKCCMTFSCCWGITVSDCVYSLLKVFYSQVYWSPNELVLLDLGIL